MEDFEDEDTKTGSKRELATVLREVRELAKTIKGSRDDTGIHSLSTKLDAINDKQNRIMIEVELMKHDVNALSSSTKDIKDCQTNLGKENHEFCQTVQNHISRVEEIAGGGDLKDLRATVDIAKNTKRYIVVFIVGVIGSITKFIFDLFL